MISTKGRYALRVMLDLAENDSGKFIPLKDVAERQNISKKYLEIIVKDLVKGGLVSGASGKGGGYRLCRKPEEYTVGEILDLTENTALTTVACLAEDAEKCPYASPQAGPRSWDRPCPSRASSPDPRKIPRQPSCLP